jgi:hypothetical protein
MLPYAVHPMHFDDDKELTDAGRRDISTYENP